MSTVRKSVRVQKNDLRMVFYKTEEDFARRQNLIREGKILRTDPIFIPSKIVSLLKEEGVKFRQVLKPIAKSDLTPEQREDIKSRKAKLIKVGYLKLFFFFKPEP